MGCKAELEIQDPYKTKAAITQPIEVGIKNEY